MGQTPSVSVIMIFWNAARFLGEAVESVLAQTYPDWELLLVDDGSTDASSALARAYAAAHPGRVRCLEHPGRANRGMSASRNLGLRHARGRYLAFLDADDVWLLAKLEQQVAMLDFRPDAGMVCCPSHYWYSWTGSPDDLGRDYVANLGARPGTLVKPPGLVPLFYPLGSGAAPGMSGILVRREVAERVGGFEESFRGLYEDQVFLTKVYLGTPVLVTAECWFRYRIHPESCCAVAIGAGQYDSVRRTFLQWLGEYLAHEAIKDSKTWRAYRRALFPYRHPALWRLNPLRPLRRVRGLLKRAAKRVLCGGARGV
jgi:glycosyltransferase involved in cell wall biosynthesis